MNPSLYNIYYVEEYLRVVWIGVDLKIAKLFITNKKTIGLLGITYITKQIKLFCFLFTE